MGDGRPAADRDENIVSVIGKSAQIPVGRIGPVAAGVVDPTDGPASDGEGSDDVGCAQRIAGPILEGAGVDDDGIGPDVQRVVSELHALAIAAELEIDRIDDVVEDVDQPDVLRGERGRVHGLGEVDANASRAWAASRTVWRIDVGDSRSDGVWDE